MKTLAYKIFGILVFSLMFVALINDSTLARQPESNENIVAYLRGGDKIEGQLLDDFANRTVDFIVRFTDQANLTPAYSMDWDIRGEFVYNTLRDNADTSQANAKTILDERGLAYQTFIAGNDLYVWGGTQTPANELAAVNELAALPEVYFIRASRTYHIDPIAEAKPSNNINWTGDIIANDSLKTDSGSIEATIAWGITDTKADQFWTTFGVQGDGIVVASIDTGVQWDHPAIDQAYKCADPSDPACWFDPANICGGSACDNNGHGTHIMGIMVGDDDPSLSYNVGMAPNAKWIACKGCESSLCSDFALNACADWILAPNSNPANRPNVVNNSWGSNGNDPWFKANVQAWAAAGIFSTFPAGNGGPSCNSLISPGDYQEAFGSTAHDINRNIPNWTSRGPSYFGYDPYTKPNISTPGVDILSSVPINNWDYRSGTSITTPHVAGAVALLWSCNPSLIGHVNLTIQFLQNNTDESPASACGAPPDGQGNNTYGYGYLNILKAGNSACGWAGPNSISGHIADTNGNPISGVNVFARSGGSTVADLQGNYTITGLLAGTYTVSPSLPGYTFSPDSQTVSVPPDVIGQIFIGSPQHSGNTERVSISTSGHQGNGVSYLPSISADGRYVAFYSLASNLVSGDTNGAWDIFVYDRQTDEISRVSVSSSGEQGNGYSEAPSISGDGRYVAFDSYASNLVSGDTNGNPDVFVHDRQTGETRLVSISSGGEQGNDKSASPSISADGRYVAFVSDAINLVSGDTNGFYDIFVHDRLTRETSRISVSSSGEQGNFGSLDPTISADGRYVAFNSNATNLVSGYIIGYSNVFLHDRQTSETILISVSSGGEQGNNLSYGPSISADGRYIAFSSNASNLVSGDTINYCDTDGDYIYDDNCPDAFVHDRITGETSRISLSSSGEQGNNTSYGSFISSNGRYVAFESLATNLVDGDTNEKYDVFMHDRVTEETIRVSVDNYGMQGNGDSHSSSISADGRYIGFFSDAFNLVCGDTNGFMDVFVRDRFGEAPWTCERRPWTIMYYQAGDNAGLDNMLQYETYKIRDGSNNSNLYIPVFRDTLLQSAVYEAYVDGQRVISDIKSELNTGDAKTLSDFIIWAKTNFPAENYALVIVDHGNGLKGTSQDYSNNLANPEYWLSPQRFRKALEDSGMFDVIYMEACLVANIEHAYQARGHALYYVASEALMIGFLNHSYLKQITIQTSAAQLSIAMAMNYYDRTWGAEYSRTISVGDMSKIEQVKQTTNAFASTIRAHRIDMGEPIWGIIDGNIVQRFEDGSGNVLADLFHFAQLVGGLNEPDLTITANNLMTAINQYMIYNNTRPGQKWDLSNAHGLSILLSKDPACYYTSASFDFAGAPSWYCGQSPQTINQDTGEWGQMLSDLIVAFNPNPQPQFEPPPLVPLDFQPLRVFIPFVANP